MNTLYFSFLSRTALLIAVSLTCGQTASIAVGSGEQTDSTAQAAAPKSTASEGYGPAQKIEILFGGSLCPVCLVAFQKRLMATDGVKTAQVESIRKEAHEDHSGHPPKRAHAIIEFVPDKISQEALETIIRQNDFQFIKTLHLSDTNP